MSKNPRIIFAFALLLLGGALFAHSFAEQYSAMGIGSAVSPVFYPRLLLVLWIILAVIIVVEALRRLPRAEKASPQWAAPIGMMLVTGVAIWAMRWAGYIGVAGPLALVCGWLLGYRKIYILVAVAAISAVITWWLFDQVLGIPLPRWRLT